jgi:hypothetical protein
VEPIAPKAIERARLAFPPHNSKPLADPTLVKRLACQVCVQGDVHVGKNAGFWGQRYRLLALFTMHMHLSLFSNRYNFFMLFHLFGFWALDFSKISCLIYLQISISTLQLQRDFRAVSWRLQNNGTATAVHLQSDWDEITKQVCSDRSMNAQPLRECDCAKAIAQRSQTSSKVIAK